MALFLSFLCRNILNFSLFLVSFNDQNKRFQKIKKIRDVRSPSQDIFKCYLFFHTAKVPPFHVKKYLIFYEIFFEKKKKFV